MNQSEWDEQYQMLDARCLRLLQQKAELNEELERIELQLARTRQELAQLHTVLIYELFSLKSQLGALHYMKKCRKDELKIINTHISEVHTRMEELEDVQGVLNKAVAQAIKEI